MIKKLPDGGAYSHTEALNKTWDKINEICDYLNTLPACKACKFRGGHQSHCIASTDKGSFS